ncbi:glycosyltransferase [Salmonirosea aquatica]
MAQGFEKVGVQIDKIPYFPFEPLSKTLRITSADVILLDWVHSFYTSPSLIPTVVKTLAGIRDRHKIRHRQVPIIWNIHNLHRHDNRHQLLEQWSFRQLARAVDGIRIFNQCSTSVVQEYLALPASTPIRHIPHGNYSEILGRDPNLDLNQKLGIESEDWTLLILGEIREGKGVVPFVKTFCTYNQNNPGLKLVVAGKPQNSTLARDLMETAATYSSLRLHLQYVPDCQLLNFLDLARFVVLPYENILNSGMAALAFSAGKPVIASELFVGHFPENIVLTGNLHDVQSLGLLIERARQLDEKETRKKVLEFAKTLEWSVIAEQIRLFGEELLMRYPTKKQV